jgi:hypothetical protein
MCLAALGANSKAIVCVADKAINYGGVIEWDSDTTKIIPLAHKGLLAMISGDEDPISYLLAELLARVSLGDTRAKIGTTCRECCKSATEELKIAKFLTPNLLSKSDYIAAISKKQINAHMMSIANGIRTFEEGAENCRYSLLVCGFDSEGNPVLYGLTSPGIVTDMTSNGFHAVGSGWEFALGRLLWLDHKRTDDLEKVLYDTFDAKATSEMAPGVGYEWDAAIIIPENGNSVVRPVEKKIKNLVERAWFDKSLSPYEKRDKDDLKAPPANWKSQAKDYMKNSILPKPSSTPILPSPPSSQ